MFQAAFILAERYKLRINGQPIGYKILQMNTLGNSFNELELICETITNTVTSDIVGLVGPASSTSARYIASFAARMGLPIISYGASNVDLSDPFTYQTFYRMTPADSLLAEAIFQIFDYFSWTTCSVITSKDDYGFGGLKVLSDLKNINFTINERLVFDPQSNRFHKEFKSKLEKSHSRIVIVWANSIVSTNFVRFALQEGLLDESYIWLMTSKIHIEEFNSVEWPKLKGILAIVPFIKSESDFKINKELLNEAFNIWKTSIYSNNTFPEDLNDISPFALYTFDAVWTLIQALNKSSIYNRVPSLEKSSNCFKNILKNPTEYHMQIANTCFLGVSGIVQFSKEYVNDRINSSSYALYNIKMKKKQLGYSASEVKYEFIMRWYETTHSWKITDKNKINISWFGGEEHVTPTDYPQLNGQHLRILVIDSPPYVIVRNKSLRNMTGTKDKNKEVLPINCVPLETQHSNIVIYGFVADFIRMLQNNMHFTYTITVADFQTNYHTLVTSVEHEIRQNDIIIADIRITANRLAKVDFSTPFHDNTLRIITRRNMHGSSFRLFVWFNPFSGDVWLTILIVILCSGVIIYLFERPNMVDGNNRTGVDLFLVGVFRTLTSIVTMSGDVPLRSGSSRLIVLGLYALGVILVATYTANLSSFLTLNRVHPTISGIDDIKNGQIPFSRIGIVTNSAVSDYYIQNISDVYYSLASAEEIYLRLLDRTIDASIWDAPILEHAVDNYYCNNLTVVGIGFLRSSYGIVLPKYWPYKKDLDVNIMALRESERLGALETTWFSQQKCAISSFSGVGRNGDLTAETLSLDVMFGIFFMFILLTVVAVICHIYTHRSAIITIFWSDLKRILQNRNCKK